MSETKKGAIGKNPSKDVTKKKTAKKGKPSDGQVGGRTKGSTKQKPYVNVAPVMLESDASAATDDIGISSDWFEEMSITDAEKAEFEKLMDQCGYNALIKKLEACNSDWKQPTINIAVAGSVGTGKSTLINSLRGLKGGDKGAAKTGCTETTIEVTCYPHPENPNLKLLDLPGVGTPNFPWETYSKIVDFNNYDFLLHVSCGGFTETDLRLAKEIVQSTPNINYFFIRTHIDNDFENFKQAQHKDLAAGDRTQIAREILTRCIKFFEKAEIRNAKVFLINSYRTDHADFKKLQMSFVETVSDLKRDAMILSLTVHSEEILEKKVEVLRKQIPDAAKWVASFADHEIGEMPKLRPLREMSCTYANQLGISTSALQIIAKNFKKDISELKKIVNMKIPAILASEKNFAKYCTIHDIFLDRPGTDQRCAHQCFQIQCKSVLKCMLEMCKDESKKLQTKIALWSHEDNK